MVRLARANKQTFKYSLLIGEETKFVLDENGNKVVDYVDEETGITYYRQEGETELIYSKPITCKANIAFSGGEVQQKEFGINDASYDAILVYVKGEFPITETSLIWYENEPAYDNGRLDPKSADYKVMQIKNSLNLTRALLGKLVK